MYHTNKALTPVVFLPGLFGSLGNDIIPGTGEMDFGMAEYLYRPFIRDLESIGYKEGENLFVAYYNWREKTLSNAKKYLIPSIEKAKSKFSNSKVNIVCYSMGGLVARAYIQSDLYKYDVDKLVMIGTPNGGSVNAYYFWSGGMLPYEKIENNVLFKLLREGFLWFFKLLYGKENKLEVMHSLFPSGQELLPTMEYGNYLLREERIGLKRFIDIDSMSVKNEYFNSLNKSSLLSKGVKPYIIAGSGEETDKYLIVKKSNDKGMWKDGEPIRKIRTFRGDGTVTLNSALAIKGYVRYLHGDHSSILSKSVDIIDRLLNNRHTIRKFKKTIKKQEYYYCILCDNINEINLKFGNKEIIVKDMDKINEEDFIVRRIGKGKYWVLGAGKHIGNLQLKAIPLYGHEGVIEVHSNIKDSTLFDSRKFKSKKSLFIEF